MWDIPLDSLPTVPHTGAMASASAILRPDAKGRVGLDAFTRRLRERFGGRPISGYAAEITAGGEIVLRPRIEIDAEASATLLLDDEDRDALLAVLAKPPRPSAALRAALRAHRRSVRSR